MRYSLTKDTAHWCTAKYKQWRVGVEIKNDTFETTAWIRFQLWIKMIFTLAYYYLINKNFDKKK